MAGRTSGELAREFEAVRQQRPDIRQPVEHVSLSFAWDERALSNDEMARVADEYLRRRGHDPDRVQYVVVRHHDKDHQHCHVLLNRIRTDRALVPQQYPEYLRSKETCRELEREFGLRPVRSERALKGERPPTRAEDRMARDRALITALWLAHNMELARRSPGRALLNVAERLLPPDTRRTVQVIRAVIHLSRGR